MKSLTLPIVLTIALAFLASSSIAQTLNVTDFGAIPDDQFDDSAGIQATVNAAFSKGGGVVIFPEGKFILRDQINILPTQGVGYDISLRGFKGSVIEVSVGQGKIALYAGNLNTFAVEDLIFVGRESNAPEDFYDARSVIFSNYVENTIIARSSFFGLATRASDGTPTGVVHIGNTDARITDSRFDGSLSDYPSGGVLTAEDFRGLTVSRCTFIDYANFQGRYLSKSTGFVGSWISARNGRVFGANGQRRVLIEDSRFDEAAAIGIRLENVAWGMLRGLSFNVNASVAGRGIYLKNSGFVKIDQSWFGFSRNSRPAIDVDNVSGVEAVALDFSDGVYFIRKNGDVKVSASFCPECKDAPPEVPVLKPSQRRVGAPRNQ